MDVSVLPIMVNKDGRLLVHLAPSDDPLRMTLLGFSHPDKPGRRAVLGNLPQNLLVDTDPSHVIIRLISSRDGAKVHVVLAGNADAFSPLPYDGPSRWFSQSEFKFGPLPEGIDNVDELRSLYSESIEREDLIAILSSVHVTRTARAALVQKEEPFDSSSVSWTRIARDPEQFGRFLDTKIDASLPTLHSDAAGATTADSWKRYVTMLTGFATAPDYTGKQEVGAPVGPAARGRAAAAAAKRRASGSVPKAA